MVSIVSTVACPGLEARSVEMQCEVAPSMVGFAVVGLPGKAVAESRERVRAAISALGLALPATRITINLSPADLLKEGSHYDLPIAQELLRSDKTGRCRGARTICRHWRVGARWPGRRIAGCINSRAAPIIARHGADLSDGARIRSSMGNADPRCGRSRSTGVAQLSKRSGAILGKPRRTSVIPKEATRALWSFR